MKRAAVLAGFIFIYVSAISAYGAQFDKSLFTDCQVCGERLEEWVLNCKDPESWTPVSMCVNDAQDFVGYCNMQYDCKDLSPAYETHLSQAIHADESGIN